MLNAKSAVKAIIGVKHNSLDSQAGRQAGRQSVSRQAVMLAVGQAGRQAVRQSSVKQAVSKTRFIRLSGRQAGR